MTLFLSPEILAAIHADGSSAYPEEGAGLLLGRADREDRQVTAILSLRNAREDTIRNTRYLITPQDMLRGEQEAARRGLDIVGIFHSHPDHPNRPSEFDREWALPWFSYLITSIDNGSALDSRSWRLEDDRFSFTEEDIHMIPMNEVL